MSETLTIKLHDEARRALDRLVLHTDRSVEDLVDEAIWNYLELQEWQRQKIEAGVAAADRFEFATEEEIARIAGKYSAMR
jgi:predicted transcriptional regulator